MTYKTLKYVLFVVITHHSLAAQSNYPPAFFQMTLHVQDAMGNRDSVVLGFDPNANNTYNPQFGEEDINTPFDSVLEMRATHNFVWTNLNPFLSKRIFNDYYEGPFPLPCSGTYMYVFVRAIHQPLTFSWDSSYVYHFSYCQQKTMMTPDIDVNLIGPDFLLESGSTYTCLGGSSRHTFYVDGKTGIGGGFGLLPASSGNQDTIYGININFNPYGYTPCSYLESGTDEAVPGDIGPALSPNPASTTLKIRQLGRLIERVEIIDMSSRLVCQATYEAVEQADIPIEYLSPAMYQAIVYCTDGTRHSGRWVKI